ncbi:hypothetical protein Tco_0324006 [Tanacetum coccineum]
MKDNLPQLVVEGIRLEKEKTKADIASLEQEHTRAALSSQVSHDLAINVPPQVFAFLRNYMNNNILHVHPTLSSISSILQVEKPASYVEPCRVDAFRRQDHEDHHNDDARPEGKSNAKRQRTSVKGTYKMGESSSKTTEGSYQTKSSTQEQQQEYDLWSKDQGNDDDEVPPEEITQEFLDESWILTTNDNKRMQDALDDMMRRQLTTRPNLDDVYSDQKIVELIKTRYDQGHGPEFMKKIFVRRADGTMSSFSESDYNYLNKNDIEDLYLMCLNGKIEHLRNELIKTLIIFIRSSVIWERVHDYQLGMESYQIKVNHITPKLIFLCIEEKTPYSISSLLFVGLIYENSKKEKRIIDIDEIPKFCDATLKRVLEKVKRINLDVKHFF